MVQRLRLGDGEVTDEKIQDKLDEVFKRQMGKFNFFHCLNSFSSILVARSRILLEPQLRKTILKGFENDTRWSDILYIYSQAKVTKF